MPNEMKATLDLGTRVRLMGASSVYGTVVARPLGSGIKTGTPVVFDGDEGISFVMTDRLQRIDDVSDAEAWRKATW